MLKGQGCWNCGVNILADTPVLLYDDQCCVCATIARVVRSLSRSRISTVGHYSSHGILFKDEIFGPEETPEKMFWLVVGSTCYGGRSGILPLIIQVLRSRIVSSFGEVPKGPAVSETVTTEAAAKCFGSRSYLGRFAYTLASGEVIRREPLRFGVTSRRLETLHTEPGNPGLPV